MNEDEHRCDIAILYFAQEKLAPVPEAAKEWRPRDPPEFCRFYMGQC